MLQLRLALAAARLLLALDGTASEEYQRLACWTVPAQPDYAACAVELDGGSFVETRVQGREVTRVAVAPAW